MLKSLIVLMSTLFCSQNLFANTTLVRNAVCHYNNKSYILLAETNKGLVPNQDYVILEKDLQNPQKMARSLQGSFAVGSSALNFPLFWRPTSIPLNSCQTSIFKLYLFDEVIREFYAKVYFIPGDPRTISEDIEDLVKRGDALPFKLRVLCKSDDFTDDITFCTEITILEKYIPINPGEI